MKTARKFSRLLAIALVLSCFMTVLLPFASAVEPRYTSNGYSSTNITYEGKPYTIYLGVGIQDAKRPYVTAYCPVAGIRIVIGNVTAKFDTKNYGYVTNTGSGTTQYTSSGSNTFYISTDAITCSKGDAQVIKVLSVTSSAVFEKINYGQNDVRLSVTYTG